MSRQSAFKLREGISPEGRADFSAEQEKRKELLGTVEADRLKVTSTKYFLDIANRQNIPLQEATLRIQRSFNDQGILQGRTPEGQLQQFTKAGDQGRVVTVRLDQQERLYEVDQKTQPVLADLAKEKSEARIEKARTQKTIQSLKYFFNLINSNLSLQEISLRIQRSLDEQGFLRQVRDGRVEQFTKAGDQGQRVTVRLDQQEREYQVDPETQALLLELAKERFERNTDANKAKNAIQSLRYFLDLINSPSISELELKLRIQRSFDNQGFLQGRTPDGQVQQFTKAGDQGQRVTVRLDQQERGFQVDPETQALFLELANFTRDPRIPDEIKQNLKGFLANRDQRSLERIKELSATIADKSLVGKIETIAGRLEQTDRRLKLQQDFYAQLNANEDTKIVGAFLEEYEEKDLQDRGLVSKLRSQLFADRRFKILAASADTALTIDAKLAILDPLAKSNSGADPEADRKAANILIGDIYKAELADSKSQTWAMINYDLNPAQLRDALASLPIRPAVGNVDYTQNLLNLREKITQPVNLILQTKRIEAALNIRATFPTAKPDQVLAQIASLPQETAEDIETQVELVNLYRSFTAANKREVFDERFAAELAKKLEDELKEKFVTPELGRNKQGLAYIKQRFLQTVFPLVEAFRGDPRTKEQVEEILKRGANFVQRLKTLEQQRPLTDTERVYLESVELLSIYNPYLVAAASGDLGVTKEFLRHHFGQLSAETLAGLRDGDYVPLIQIGTGPNGLAALGEIVRNNPELAKQTLVIDAGDDVGGPFAIPRGPAWKLNSANLRGGGAQRLPDRPKEKELKTVRAYGSPYRWYPGERTGASEDVRQASINRTVDFLITPDDLSRLNYPTNEELQAILALQAAMLIGKLALRSEVLKVEPNPDPHDKGDKIVTINITDPSGASREIKLKTDALFTATGLGEAVYGFKLKGSRAEQVLEKTKNLKGFPRISRTLEAFKALSDRSKKKASPGEVVAFWGSGNSADTLLEYIAGIFQGDNPRVRDVTKVYIITEKDLSARPRYAAINDYRPRNGKRGNLIEFVTAKVTDVDFANVTNGAQTDKLVFYGLDGKVLQDRKGKPIMADSGIAATGFRPQLDSVFSAYLDGRSFSEKSEEQSPVQPVILPTNKEVPVADVLKKDPNILFLGTASKPRFEGNLPKLAQLPVEAREALLRNGAENAVAIGFRAPDTQAAVNIWINSRDIKLDPAAEKEKARLPLEGIITVGNETEIESKIEPKENGIPNDVAAETLVLSPLLTYLIGNKAEVYNTDGQGLSGELGFSLTFNPEAQRFELGFQGGASPNISAEFFDQVRQAVQDEYFQRYSFSLLSKRRRNPKLQLNIAFRNGKINPRETFVQEG